MSSLFAKLAGSEFDAMVDRGAFDCVEGKKVELIRGEMRFMNPAVPIHFEVSKFTEQRYGERRSHDEIRLKASDSAFGIEVI